MKKRILTVFMAGVMTISVGMTSLAAGWQWLDGNGDGVAESYYVNDDGSVLKDTTTPDGYMVNADGAWTVDGIVQTQSVAMNTGNYDPQYPLAGMLDQLGLNFAKDSNGIDMLYWSSQYQNRTVGYDAGPEVRWQKAKETNNLNYYYGVGQSWDEMLAIAKLAGRTDINLPYADEARADALANNVREFFKAFPNWKTASAYEKACHIARWIEQADYVTNTGNDSTTYACLINKACVCAGYEQASLFLAHCVGLEAMIGVTSAFNHTFAVFNINGVWLGYDAAGQGKENNFYIYDVYEYKDYVERAVDLAVTDLPGNTYKYFKDRGYVVPTRLNDRFDSSLIKSVGVKGVTQDALKLQ